MSPSGFSLNPFPFCLDKHCHCTACNAHSDTAGLDESLLRDLPPSPASPEGFLTHSPAQGSACCRTQLHSGQQYSPACPGGMGQHHYPARTLNNCNKQENGRIRKRGKIREGELCSRPRFDPGADAVRIPSRHGTRADPPGDLAAGPERWPGLLKKPADASSNTSLLSSEQGEARSLLAAACRARGQGKQQTRARQGWQRLTRTPPSAWTPSAAPRQCHGCFLNESLLWKVRSHQFAEHPLLPIRTSPPASHQRIQRSAGTHSPPVRVRSSSIV